MPAQKFVSTWHDEVPKSLTIWCGHCRVEVEANIRSEAIHISTQRTGPRHDTTVGGAMYVCPRPDCGKPSLVFLRVVSIDRGAPVVEIAEILPRGVPEPMEGLPDMIERDRREAWSCFNGGDFRASIIMCRAAVQRAARHCRAAAGGLKAELAELAQRRVITESVRSWGDEVRIAGDGAAHPEDLGDVSPSEARESLEFMDEFLRHAVAMPARTEARKRARKPADDAAS